jgi:proline dehydrogenase
MSTHVADKSNVQCSQAALCSHIFILQTNNTAKLQRSIIMWNFQLQRLPNLSAKTMNLLKRSSVHRQPSLSLSTFQREWLMPEANPVPDFGEAAYETKSTRELLHAGLCFGLCRFPFLIRHAEGMLGASRRLLGETLTDAVMRSTFYGHFCVDPKIIQPKTRELREVGLMTIIDFADEDVGAGLHCIDDYKIYDDNEQNFLTCIRHSKEGGFASVKVGALTNYPLLERMSLALQQGKAEAGVDYLSWSSSLSPRDLLQENGGILTETEVASIEKLYQRGHSLASEAARQGTRILMDAEQVRYQPAIDKLVLDLQRIYNVDAPIVYNTYQCYLKDVTARIKTDVERSERYSYHFGAKLVRGAYMESERALAETLGSPSPIHDTIEETHNSYDETVENLLEHAVKTDKRPEIMLASHNPESAQKAIHLMNKLGIDRREPVLSFAQLYGMKDNLTYGLGKQGFRACKLLPYGEVKKVMPYLIRRANENSSVAGGAKDELAMISKELSRRLFGSKPTRRLSAY